MPVFKMTQPVCRRFRGECLFTCYPVFFVNEFNEWLRQQFRLCESQRVWKSRVHFLEISVRSNVADQIIGKVKKIGKICFRSFFGKLMGGSLGRFSHPVNQVIFGWVMLGTVYQKISKDAEANNSPWKNKKGWAPVLFTTPVEDVSVNIKWFWGKKKSIAEISSCMLTDGPKHEPQNLTELSLFLKTSASVSARNFASSATGPTKSASTVWLNRVTQR